MDKNEILVKTLEKEKEILVENLKKATDSSSALENKNKALEERINALEKENRKLTERIETIEYSRSYRMYKKVKKILKR